MSVNTIMLRIILQLIVNHPPRTKSSCSVSLSNPIYVQPNSIAILASYVNKQFKDINRPLKCSHCVLTEHTVDRCYQIIGFPPGRKGSKAIKTKHDTYAHNSMAENGSHDPNPK